MLAKLIVHGADRADAIARMRSALGEFGVLGVRTNVGFLDALMAHEAFAAGDLHTGFLEEHPIRMQDAEDAEDAGEQGPTIPTEVLLAAALCREGRLGVRAGGGPAAGRPSAGGEGPSAMPEPWTAAGGWRNT